MIKTITKTQSIDNLIVNNNIFKNLDYYVYLKSYNKKTKHFQK